MRLASPTDLAGSPPSVPDARARDGVPASPDASGDASSDAAADALDRVDPASERVALKDARFVYRACSMAFARAIGRASPDEVVGRTDFELFPAAVAREQMALDARVVDTGHADIGTIELSGGSGEPPGTVRHAMLVRSPVAGADGGVRGVDLRLVGGPSDGALRSAVTIDYRTLVTEGMQGSLIFVGREFLFADANAARALGWESPEALVGQGEVGDAFGEPERALLAGSGHVALGARTRDGELVELVGRVAPVRWNARRATLLSFVERERAASGTPRRAPRAAGPVAARSATSGATSGAAPTPPTGAGPASPLSVSASGAASLAARIAAFERDAPAGAATRTAERALAVEAANDERSGAAGTRADGTLARDNARLRTVAARYHQYARAAADFFWEIDASLRFRRVSPELSRALGLPAAELEGRTHAELAEHASNVDAPGAWSGHLAALAERRPFRDAELRWEVDGQTRTIRHSGVPHVDASGAFAGYRGVGTDVTSAVRDAEETAYHANHDALTGLVNRRHFEELVGDALEASATDRRTHALCYLDLDSFKPVNDACGHQAGDELLRQLSQLFDRLVRKSDVLARLGGDEFGVFLYDCNVAQALKLADQIRAEVEGFRFAWEETSFQVGVSVGLVLADGSWESIDALFSAADAACYLAKDQGRNRVVVYREAEAKPSNRIVATHWVRELEAALADDRVHLACQRIEPLARQPEGLRYELLMRLEKPDGDVIRPQAFLPSAERYGLSAALDLRALELAIRWLAADPALAGEIRHVSLNLAAGSFTDEGFAADLLERVADSRIAPEKFCFELAETATIANLARATAFMERVAGAGCRFAIDNFGSGLSSFGWIRKLPVDFLKIDGLLVRDVLDDAIDLTTVHAICDIARSMGRRTVGCHVESPRLLNALTDAGADFAQGRQLGEPTLIRV